MTGRSRSVQVAVTMHTGQGRQPMITVASRVAGGLGASLVYLWALSEIEAREDR